MFLHGSTKPVQHLVNPSDRPIGDPGMVHLPEDIQKCAICQNSVTRDLTDMSVPCKCESHWDIVESFPT